MGQVGQGSLVGQVTVGHCVGVGHVSPGGGGGQVVGSGVVGHCGQGVEGEGVGGSITADARRNTNIISQLDYKFNFNIQLTNVNVDALHYST